MCLFYALVFLLLQYNHLTRAKLCRIESPNISENTTRIEEVNTNEGPQSIILNCPRPEDPPEFINCCYYEFLSNKTQERMGDVIKNENGMPTCCPNEDDQSLLFYYISDRIALLIAVTVTGILLIITIVVVICCFWSRCPFYMMCRVRYRQDDIIAYASKDDETMNLNEMPPEEQKGIKVYSPNAVKVTLKDDV